MRISKEGTCNERIKNQRVWSSLNNYISSAKLPCDVMIKKVSTEKNLRTLLSKREEWKREYADYNLKENTVKWYNTDVSKTSTGAGAGRYVPSTKCALSLGSCMIVFQAKILAIGRCLDINLERNNQKCDMAIYSDSKAAIEALSFYIIDSKMIWECWNKLNEVGNKNEVFLTWVPDHSGIKGNEEANTLAKEKARMSLIGPEHFCGIGKCIYKKELLQKEKAEREKLRWNLIGMDHH